MESLVLQKAYVQEKRMYTLLNETLDLSRQLAEAVDRDDQVAMRMLLSMRREPLEKLRDTRRTLEGQRDALPTADANRLAALLNGAEAEQREEAELAEQVAVNDRLLKQLVEFDQVLNRKIGRDKSLYHQKNLDTGPPAGGYTDA